MAFSTQKEFFYVPFRNETVQFECKEECVKLKSYASATDDRSWALKDGQQSRYLSDLVTCRMPVNTAHEDSEDDDQAGRGRSGKRGGKGRSGGVEDDDSDESGGKSSRSGTPKGRRKRYGSHDPYPTSYRGPRGGGSIGRRGTNDDAKSGGGSPGRGGTNDDGKSGSRGRRGANDDAKSGGGSPGRGGTNNDGKSGSRGRRGANDDAESGGGSPGRGAANDDGKSSGGSRGRRGTNDDAKSGGGSPARRGNNDDPKIGGSRRPDEKKRDRDNFENDGTGKRRSTGSDGSDRDSPDGTSKYDGDHRVGKTGTAKSESGRGVRGADKSESDEKNRKGGTTGLGGDARDRNGRNSPDGTTKYQSGSDRSGDAGTGRNGPGGRGRDDDEIGFDGKEGRIRANDLDSNDPNRYDRNGRAIGADQIGSDDKGGRAGANGLDRNDRNRNDRNSPDGRAKYPSGGDRSGDAGTARNGPGGGARSEDQIGLDGKEGRIKANGLDSNDSNRSDRNGRAIGADQLGSDDKGGRAGANGLDRNDRNRNDRNGPDSSTRYDGSERSGNVGAAGIGPGRYARGADQREFDDHKIVGPNGSRIGGAALYGQNGHDGGIGSGGARSVRPGGEDGALTREGDFGTNKNKRGVVGGIDSETSADQRAERTKREVLDDLYNARGGKISERNVFDLGGAGTSATDNTALYRKDGTAVIRSEYGKERGVFAPGDPRQGGNATSNIDPYNYERSAIGLDGAGRHQDGFYGPTGRGGTGEVSGGRGLGNLGVRDAARQGGIASGNIDEYGNMRGAVGQGGIASGNIDEYGAVGPGGFRQVGMVSGAGGTYGNLDGSNTAGIKCSGAYDSSAIKPGDSKRTITSSKTGVYDPCGKEVSLRSSRGRRDMGGPSGPCASSVNLELGTRGKVERTSQRCDEILNAKKGSFCGALKVQKSDRSCFCNSTPDAVTAEHDSNLILIANTAMTRLNEMLMEKENLEKQLEAFNKRLCETTHERDDLREKLKQFKELEKKVAELQRTARDSNRASDDLNVNFNEQAKYAGILENELRKTENYYEEKIKELTQREQSALRQVNNFKEQLLKANKHDPKVESLKRENGELCFQVKALHMALNEYDCQYKQLLMKVAMFKNQGYSFNASESKCSFFNCLHSDSECSTDKSDY